jgi:hypothetical protein
MSVGGGAADSVAGERENHARCRRRLRNLCAVGSPAIPARAALVGGTARTHGKRIAMSLNRRRERSKLFLDEVTP